MTLTTPLPIFPDLKPAQSWTAPLSYLRSNTWVYKETAKWNNSRQQSVTGHTSTVKYWSNPLWDFEWTYGYLNDNPSNPNPFYAQPIPATDLAILKGFFGGMQGGGNRFLYQPPDSVYGGAMVVTGVGSVPGIANCFNIYGTNAASLGQMVSIPAGTLSAATFLNSQNLTIIGGGYGFGYITVYLSHAAYSFAADSGTIYCGQLLTVDANNNAELRHNYGAYPIIPLAGSPPACTLTDESVQVIDSSRLIVKDNGGAPPSFTIGAADSIAPYQGLVLQFTSAPTGPVIAGFNWYHLCRMMEDTQEYDNFLTMIWMCNKFSFEQDRL